MNSIGNTGHVFVNPGVSPTPASTGGVRAQKEASSSPVDQLPVPPSQASPEASLPPNISLTPTDRGVVVGADSGLSLNVEGQVHTLTIPGLGTVRHDFEKNQIEGPDGQPVTVHTSALGGFDYSYTAKDGSKVHVDTDNMAYTFESKDGSVLQSVDKTGGHYIRINNTFSPDGGKTQQPLVKELFVQPDGTVLTAGDVEGLQVNEGRVSFKNPLGHTVSQELPVPTYAPKAEGVQLELPFTEFKPAGGSLLNPEVSASATGPIVVESAPPEAAPVSAAPASETPLYPNGPTQQDIKANLTLLTAATSGGEFAGSAQRLANGTTRIESGDKKIHLLENGLALCYDSSKGVAYAIDTANGSLAPAQLGEQSSDSQGVEKSFSFHDSKGNKFTTFETSNEILAESPDGRLGQMVLPDGAKLVGLKNDQGESELLSLSAKGELTTSPGLKPKVGSTYGIEGVKLQSAAGEQVIDLPIPISTRAQAPKAETASASAPPPPPPEDGASVSGGAPPPLPPDDPNALADASVMPEPGRTQQGFKPNLWNRFKYFLTGNDEHLQPKTGDFPRSQPPIPPYLGGCAWDPFPMGGWNCTSGPTVPWGGTPPWLAMGQTQVGMSAAAAMMTHFASLSPFPSMFMMNPMMGMMGSGFGFPFMF